jgi:hypothetical protein
MVKILLLKPPASVRRLLSMAALVMVATPHLKLRINK